MKDNLISAVKEIRDAFTEPWSDFSFVLYFLTMIVGFGGIGIYLSIYQYVNISVDASNIQDLYKDAIAQNMMTYSVAILIPAALSIFLHVIIPRSKHIISHSIITLSLSILNIILICFTFFDGNMLVAIPSTILSWAFWVIANSKNKSLKDNEYYSEIKNSADKHGEKWGKN